MNICIHMYIPRITIEMAHRSKGRSALPPLDKRHRRPRAPRVAVAPLSLEPVPAPVLARNLRRAKAGASQGYLAHEKQPPPPGLP